MVFIFGTLIKNVRAVRFLGKPDFLERVCFHPPMLFVTNFGIAFVISMGLFSLKNKFNKFQEIFLSTVKNTHDEKFEQVEKFMPCFLSSNAILKW